MIDRTRARLDVKRLKTIFGRKARPHRDRKGKAPRLEVVVETPAYDLTIFKLHFGKLTLKAYSKGEHILRFEAIVHNTKDLGCGRMLDRFPQIVIRLRQILEQFLEGFPLCGAPGDRRDFRPEASFFCFMDDNFDLHGSTPTVTCRWNVSRKSSV